MFACQVIPSEFGVRGLGGRHIRPPAPLPNPQEAAPRAPTFCCHAARGSSNSGAQPARLQQSTQARASCLAGVDCPRGRRKLVKAAETSRTDFDRHRRSELEHDPLAVATRKITAVRMLSRRGPQEQSRSSQRPGPCVCCPALARGTMIDVTEPLRATSGTLRNPKTRLGSAWPLSGLRPRDGLPVE
jgi:hypothetical protein